MHKNRLLSSNFTIFSGHPVVNDPLYNHPVFGPARGRGGDFGGKAEDQLVAELLEVENKS